MVEKVLVLRLLIYGIITQTADRKQACGENGMATSFRRPDGITIVCLPLPANDTGTLGKQGITLRITPNHNQFDKSVDIQSEVKVEPELTTTVPPVDEYHPPLPPQPEAKVDEENEEEVEEEEETETKKPEVSGRQRTPIMIMEQSQVEYEPEQRRPEEEEPEEKVEGEVQRKSKRKVSPKTITLAELPDISGGEHGDDEIEQYILIRRRKKKNKTGSDGRQKLIGKNDVMLPLESKSSGLASKSTEHIGKRRRRKKKTTRSTKRQTMDRQEAKVSPTVIDIRLGGSGVAVVKEFKGEEEGKREKRKQKNRKEEKVKQKRQSEEPNEEEEEKPAKPHQIFIINVPITHNNNYSTTIRMPEKRINEKNEQQFEKFLHLFNFTKQDGQPMKRETSKHLEEDSQLPPPPSPPKRKKRIKKKRKKKKEKKKAEPPEEKPETIYNFLISKQISNSKPEKEIEKKSLTRRVDDQDVEYFIKVKNKIPTGQTNPETKFDDGTDEAMYELMKVTQYIMQHNQTGSGQPPRFPTNGSFHQYNHQSFKFKKQSETSHEENENYFGKRIQTKAPSRFLEEDESKQPVEPDPVIARMLDKIQAVSWFKQADAGSQ